MSENILAIDESDGYVSIEMPINFYDENIELFENNENIKLKSAYRKVKPPQNDKVYREKLEAFLAARNELLEYEVEMRYKQLINK